MAELNDAQKLELVEELACFVSPKEIIARFRQEHGVELSYNQVGLYDPTRTYFEAGDKWREVFDNRRKRFLEDVDAVPASSQAFRLHRLNEGAEKARLQGNYKLMAELLEQAAKEQGGLLTNQRSMRIDDNRANDPRSMTPEDRRMALADLLHGALEVARERAAKTIKGKVIEG